MTPEESKYILTYLDYYEKRNGKITSEDEKELTKLQDSLGLNFSRCWELIEKAKKGKISDEELEFASMQAKSVGTETDDLQLSTVMLNEDDPYYALIKEIDQYEEFAIKVISDFSTVSERVSEIKSEVFNIADILANQGTKTFKKGDKRVGGAMVAIAGIAELGAYGWEKWQNYKSNQKLRKHLDELLAKKQEMANAKYNTIKQHKDRYSSELLPKFQKLYDREFMVSVSPDDNLLEKRIEMFKKSFVIIIKSKYLDQIMSFVLSEMRAWKQGEQDSDAMQPTIKEIVDREIKTWFRKLQLRESYKDINQYLEVIIEKEQKSLPLPICFIFSEPYLFKTMLEISPENIKKNEFTERLLDMNDYYKEYIHLMNSIPSYSCVLSSEDKEILNKAFWKSFFTCLILLPLFFPLGLVISIFLLRRIYKKGKENMPIFSSYSQYCYSCEEMIENGIDELKIKYNKI